MKKEHPVITKELLEQRWEYAQKLYDELYDDYTQSISKGESLTGLRLCEKSNEYENYVLETQRLQELMHELEEKEPKIGS